MADLSFGCNNSPWLLSPPRHLWQMTWSPLKKVFLAKGVRCLPNIRVTSLCVISGTCIVQPEFSWLPPSSIIFLNTGIASSSHRLDVVFVFVRVVAIIPCILGSKRMSSRQVRRCNSALLIRDKDTEFGVPPSISITPGAIIGASYRSSAIVRK